MSIGSIFGAEGILINIEDKDDVYEAVDAIHTMCLDNFGEDSDEVAILSRTIDSLLELEN